ncbi:MAG: zinc ribbon domain-containing protein [Candidatus Schekmanbacteria bacterium]|nr:zinc ribbon domain-containing protein [Candidatus Schekmanbacteria bacterium]
MIRGDEPPPRACPNCGHENDRADLYCQLCHEVLGPERRPGTAPPWGTITVGAGAGNPALPVHRAGERVENYSRAPRRDHADAARPRYSKTILSAFFVIGVASVASLFLFMARRHSATADRAGSRELAIAALGIKAVSPPGGDYYVIDRRDIAETAAPRVPADRFFVGLIGKRGAGGALMLFSYDRGAASRAPEDMLSQLRATVISASFSTFIAADPAPMRLGDAVAAWSSSWRGETREEGAAGRGRLNVVGRVLWIPRANGAAAVVVYTVAGAPEAVARELDGFLALLAFTGE